MILFAANLQPTLVYLSFIYLLWWENLEALPLIVLGEAAPTKAAPVILRSARQSEPSEREVSEDYRDYFLA